MGENGAGKSTLIKIVTGVYKPDSGRLLLDGQPAEFASPRDALAAAIGAVHQERNLIPRFSVGENILLEHLPTRNGMVDYAEVHRQARAFLDLLDRAIDTRAEVATLSVAQMQIVEIAKALSLKAKLLLLDEPTASISGHEAAALFERAAPAQGAGRRHCLRQPQARGSALALRSRDGVARRQDRRRRRAHSQRHAGDDWCR